MCKKKYKHLPKDEYYANFGYSGNASAHRGQWGKIITEHCY